MCSSSLRGSPCRRVAGGALSVPLCLKKIVRMASSRTHFVRQSTCQGAGADARMGGDGGLAEWSIATALKAVRPRKGLGGSNPSPAAIFFSSNPLSALGVVVSAAIADSRLSAPGVFVPVSLFRVGLEKLPLRDAASADGMAILPTASAVAERRSTLARP